MKEDHEASTVEPSGRRGTNVLSPASEQDACLLHEDDSDQSTHSCPSPTDRGGDDLAASSPLQVWFDMGALGAHVCDNLEAIATTVQHLRTAFRSDVQSEPPKEVPDNSESITCSHSEVERKFAVRNVTELIVDDGEKADRGRKTRWNDVDGSVPGVKSAGRVGSLLRNKRSFGELWNQKGEIPCDKQLCSFPTLSEQESSQTRQMDRGEIEVEDERRARTKRMPVLPTDREKHEDESAHVANRSLCKTKGSRKHLENESSLPRVAMDRGFLAHSTDADLVTNTMLKQKLHSVAEARQVSHEAPESHAVNCVLETFRMQSQQQRRCSAVCCWLRGARAQSIREA